jgi:ElaB/YqjD/DUF883 family membrane-anchored ribosome-binding protein
VKEGIHDATIGRVEHMARNASDRAYEARTTVMDTIRENPIPAAMIAVGLSWLLFNGRKRTVEYDRYTTGTRPVVGRSNLYGADYGTAAYGTTGYPASSADYGESYGGAYANQTPYVSGSYATEEEGRLAQLRDRAGDLGSGVRDRAVDIKDRAQHLAGSAADRTQDLAHNVADRTQDLAQNVADRTRRVSGRVEDKFYDNPLAIGAVSLALGVAAGLATPTTDTEVRLMGDARDRLVDRVKDVAQETAEKAQHVAERVVDETKHTVAQTVTQTAKEAARDEGLTR